MVTSDLSIAQLVLGATPVGKAVLILLPLLSVFSWIVIIRKRLILTSLRRSADQFENRFWSGIALPQLFTEIDAKAQRQFGQAALFHAGFQEFMKARQSITDPMMLVSGVQRAMRVAQSREESAMDSGLSFLASVASSSPYIGLFGTVWGTMVALIALRGVEQVTIAQIAPGIAEALITTAVGIIAAVPAVVAYNRFNSELDRLLNRYDSFIEEFSNILQRQLVASQTASSGYRP